MRFLLITLAASQLCLATSSASTSAQQPAVRLMVPGVGAACRADADQRARTEMRLKSIEWADAPSEPAAAAQGDAHAITRIEIAGRARSASGWLRLTADCTYAKGRPAAVSLHVQPEPAIDLSGITRFSPAPTAKEQISQLAPPGSFSSSEPNPSVRVKASLTELPFDPMTQARKQDFLNSHQVGIKLQAPF